LTGLQQGTIDGQENGPILTQTSRFYEAQRYLLITNHSYSVSALTINEQFFQTLPLEYQQILMEEGERVGWLQIQWSRELAIECIQIMQDSGVAVSHLSQDPALLNAFQEAALAVWAEFRDRFDSEVMDYIFSELAK